MNEKKPLNQIIKSLHEKLNDELLAYKYKKREESIIHKVADDKIEEKMSIRRDNGSGAYEIEDDDPNGIIDERVFVADLTQALNRDKVMSQFTNDIIKEVKNIIQKVKGYYKVTQLSINRKTINDVHLEINANGTINADKVAQIITARVREEEEKRKRREEIGAKHHPEKQQEVGRNPEQDDKLYRLKQAAKSGATITSNTPGAKGI